jgi:transposase-like protein
MVFELRESFRRVRTLHFVVKGEGEAHACTSANNYPPELRERAIRMVGEVRPECTSVWAACQSVAANLGIGAPQTLLNRVREAQVEAGQRPGTNSNARWASPKPG